LSRALTDPAPPRRSACAPGRKALSFNRRPDPNGDLNHVALYPAKAGPRPTIRLGPVQPPRATPHTPANLQAVPRTARGPPASGRRVSRRLGGVRPLGAELV